MKIGSARRQVAINLAFTIVKSASVLLSIRLADTLLTAQVLGFVLLFRRVGSLGGNFLQLGFSQSLQRYYLAIADTDERARLWSVLVRWVLLSCAVAIGLSVLFGQQVSIAALGVNDRLLALAFAVYVSSIAIGFMANSSWMVEFKFGQFNVIDWLNGSLLFILCLVFLGGRSTDVLVMALAISGILASGASLLLFRQRHVAGHVGSAVGWSIGANVVSYGFTRALTAVADIGTTVLGPWLLSDTPEQAGQLIIAYTIIRIAQAIVVPMASVLALRANSASLDVAVEERRVIVFGLVAVASAVICMAFYYAIGPAAISLIAPNSQAGVSAMVDRFIPFLPAIFGFYAMRNFVDIRYHFPVNLCTLAASMVAMLLVIWWQGNTTPDTVVLGSVAMFGVLYVYVAIVVGAMLFRMKR